MAKATTGECLARLPNVPHYHRFAKSGLAESGKRCILLVCNDYESNLCCLTDLVPKSMIDLISDFLTTIRLYVAKGRF